MKEHKKFYFSSTTSRTEISSAIHDGILECSDKINYAEERGHSLFAKLETIAWGHRRKSKVTQTCVLIQIIRSNKFCKGHCFESKFWVRISASEILLDNISCMSTATYVLRCLIAYATRACQCSWSILLTRRAIQRKVQYTEDEGKHVACTFRPNNH